MSRHAKDHLAAVHPHRADRPGDGLWSRANARRPRRAAVCRNASRGSRRASGAGKTLTLATAQPSYGSTATTGPGLDLDVVYAGLGSEADFAGRDVRGKAVLLFSMPLPGSWRHTATAEQAIRRAQDKGAAAIICSIQLPGNIRTQLYPTNTNVPTFSMGMKDGMDFRDLLGAGPVKVKVRLDVQMVPNQKTATVWGTLPGITDETIYILGHRDGWFESATDNASGVATMVGLAEYFAKVPRAERRRTIVFLGTSGHHNSGNYSGTYLFDHRDATATNVPSCRMRRSRRSSSLACRFMRNPNVARPVER
jgi:Peptidase family M28